MQTVTRLPIVDRRIRFALVDCGRISKNHLAALAEHSERTEIVALCCPDCCPESTRAVQRVMSLPMSADLTHDQQDQVVVALVRAVA